MKTMLLLIVSLQVNTNGIISFDGQNNQRRLRPFGEGYGRPLVAPLACDINTLRNHGRVYYRSTTDSATLQQVSSDVSNGTHFAATSAFIATWLNVTHSLPSGAVVSKLCRNSYPLSASNMYVCTILLASW